MKDLEELKGWISENRYLLLIWIASTLFFLYQQSTGLSWDFAVYEMNAEYLCCDGHYFEWARPPFAPLLMILSSAFTLFTWNYAGYVYVVIVSAIFGFGSVKFADEFGVDRRLFYALILSPFVLNMGLMAGTELLTLGLLMFFLSYIKDIKGAVFMGLAGLSRYPAFIFFPLVLFQKNWKKILASLLVIGLVVSPWLLYNEMKRDDPIYSLENSYALNVEQRHDTVDEPGLMDFLLPIGYYLPLLFLGAYFKWKENWGEKDWIIVAFTALAVFSYLRTPHKEPRYLFNLILPAAYFSYHSLRDRHEKIFIVVLAVNLVLAGAFFVPLGEYADMGEAVQATGNCMATSNLWVPMNYHGKPTEPISTNISESLEQGNRVVLFKHASNYETYLNRIDSEQPIIEETEIYTVFGYEDRCSPERKADRSFLVREGELNDIEGCEDMFPWFICVFSPSVA
ncbi:MAG: hypothetical protein ACLFQ8_00615 [Candidatus Aenigmatarchaeota archaeon]